MVDPSPHACRAVGCPLIVAGPYLMCPRHWYMIPMPLRTLIWQTYRPGEITQEWIEAANTAVSYIAQRENRVPPPDTHDLIQALRALIAEHKE